jgi:hypothetical protein
MAITRSITRGMEHFAMDGVAEGETVILGLKLEWEVVLKLLRMGKDISKQNCTRSCQ